MRFVRIIHTIWGSLGFVLLFFILFIPLLVPIFFPRQFRLVGILNRIWAKGTFIFCFLPYRVECRSELDRSQQYIFCPNHFSYLDIPTMGLNPFNTVFVGKREDMATVPVFGFMYGKLHITVDRTNLRSKYDTFVKAGAAIDEGKSLVFYPEGGIYTKNPPTMVRFKDGAFRLAIEKQIKVVPVTIPNNWIILPVDPFILQRGTVKVIFHEPIDTKGMKLEDIERLKQQVFQTIDDELKIHANRPNPAGQDRAPLPS
jgi:1-acyl-sn-glycerol-3-phosphate acyltransferase